MPSCKRNSTGQVSGGKSVPSKQMDGFPENFFPIFVQNQFRTKIELPTREKYPGVEARCVIITGSNTGLGFESARQFLSLGVSHLVMGVRSIDRGNEAAAKLRQANPSARIDVWKLDMESYKSIQAFVQKCQQDLTRIDNVILNAGLSNLKYEIAPETGHEKTVQVNHFGTALLGLLLLPVLKEKSKGLGYPPQMTVVNSLMAHLCKLPNKDQRPFLASFDDTAITPWDPQERYGASKLLSQLFLVRLAERVSPDYVTINMVDPGLTKDTRLWREITGLMAVGAGAFTKIAGRPVDRGAATYIDAALGLGRESHGCFLMNSTIAP